MCYKHYHKIDKQPNRFAWVLNMCLSHNTMIFPLYLTGYFNDSFSFIHLVTEISVALTIPFERSALSNSVDFPSFLYSNPFWYLYFANSIIISSPWHFTTPKLSSLLLPLSPVLKISHSWLMYYYRSPLFRLVMLIPILPEHWTLLWHFFFMFWTPSYFLCCYFFLL